MSLAALLMMTALPGSAMPDMALAVPNPRVLVFSKTAGFRHDAIGPAVAALRDGAARWGLTLEATEDASAFSTSNLSKFDCVVFLLTTGDVLDDGQQAAFESYIRGGGGYVGVHAAADTEYDWSFYGRLVGGYFLSHPAIQPAAIRIEDRAHPTTAHLPNPWLRTDEWYDYRANPRSQVNVLANLDPTSYKDSKMGEDHPIVWWHDALGGRAWYTGLGHTAASYREEPFMRALFEGMVWAAQGKRPAGAVALTRADFEGSEKWAENDGMLDNVPNQAREHLVSKRGFGDALVHLEFRLPKGSNSGVYLQGRYEVQIFDSHGKADSALAFSDAGGIYQRYDEAAQKGWEGTPPKRDALRTPGQWNTMDILFRAPRFDASGKKIANAKVVEVRLNGVVVQRDVELTGPTRAPMRDDEVAKGPLRLQGDHGPVAFRNIWVREW